VRVLEPWRVIEGDSIDVLRGTPDNTYTAVVTDPPYGLSKPPPVLDVLKQWIEVGEYIRKTKSGKSGSGFLGHTWDDFVPGPALWREVFRTCKPGAIALVFASTRTYHWMVLGMLLAGFECLDTIGWVQAESMPHAGTIDKRIDARLGAEREVVGRVEKLQSFGVSNGKRVNEIFGGGPDKGGFMNITIPATPQAAEWQGWSTELCGAIEPIAVMRRPCEGTATSNVLKHGCGAMNVRACATSIDPDDPINDATWTERRSAVRPDVGGLISSSVDGNSRSAAPALGGRWPKNIMLDEVVADLLDQQIGERKSGSRRAGVRSGMGYSGAAHGDGGPAIKGSRGGPSRYFWVGPCATEDDVLLPIHYFPKVRFSEREVGLPVGLVSRHPTVKPQALMQRLCRLVGHPKGRILDPFAGTGTTLRAARAEGLPCDGVERDPEYARLARHRAGVALLRDYRGLAPHRLPTDPRSFLAEWLLDNI
jgi:DNA modification methylase